MDDTSDFTICKVSWHTRRAGAVSSAATIERIFIELVTFLQAEKLVHKTLLREGEHPGDEFCVMRSDLTDEGFAVIKKALDKWLKGIDKGKDPADTRTLSKALKTIRDAP